MKTSQQQEKIERYLLNQMDPQEEMEFRGDILLDEQLRKEVHLTRLSLAAVQQHLSKKQRPFYLRHRKALLATLSVATLAIIVAINYPRTSSQVQPPPPAQDTLPNAPQPSLMPIERGEAASPTQKEVPTAAAEPIAAATTPKDATLSKLLVKSNWRSSHEVTTLHTPYINNTTYQRNERGYISLNWSGLITGTPKPEATIEILLFADDDLLFDQGRSLWSASQTVNTDDSVRINTLIDLAPGKYYLMIKDKTGTSQDIINTNVFLVR